MPLPSPPQPEALSNEAVDRFLETLLLTLTSRLGDQKPKLCLYSIVEAAQVLGVKERTIKHHLHEAKDLRYLTIGREIKIRHQDLEAFIEARLRPIILDHELLAQ